MKIVLPELSLIAVVGASGSGKSTFAAKHFKPTEVLSSDYFRALVSDNENNQDVTDVSFETLHYVLAKRLKLGRLTVCDATNVKPESRKSLVALAREYHCIPVAIVFNLPPAVCVQRNKQRPDRTFGDHVVRNQSLDLKRSIRNLKREGFRHVFIFNSSEEVDAIEIERQPLWNNRKTEHGPLDLIGDVHGCFDELRELLLELGYLCEPGDGYQFGQGFRVHHPEGRKLVFVGDLVDRGPSSTGVLRLVMSGVYDGTAYCVPGNHDVKLVRKLMGKDVKIAHGLAQTLEQLEREPAVFKDQVRDFLDGLVSHYVFDDGKLVVAHAGMKEEYQGRGSGRVREFALFGETTGETDDFGLPVRFNWAEEYRGRAMVVYGHTPVLEAEWLNRTMNIDTGCVFGGRLTAFRYPEKEVVSVEAKAVYQEPARPIGSGFAKTDLSAQLENDDMLHLEDVLGKRIIQTRLRNSVTIQEENATAALEVMSRFAVNPRWLIYLPPTMSPTETSEIEGFLEHPREAFTYFAKNGLDTVICEEKHMGSRAVLIMTRNSEVTERRFGIADGSIGICYTRTGRRFLEASREKELLQTVNDALSACNFWEDLGTDWVCLDCELMPWSLKAQELLRHQYAAVGAAGTSALQDTVQALETAVCSPDGSGMEALLHSTTSRLAMVEKFVASYRRYCWPVHSLSDIKLAPFHILATEGAVHTDKDHLWHMDHLKNLCSANSELFRATPFRRIDLKDEASCEAGVNWWLEMTEAGGEGMVVKPLNFIQFSKKGLVQPAVKCRGKEYLRIIYGPEYDSPQNLERLRSRGLSAKRSLAIRELCLGVESLHRFVEKEPLRRIHECVFGILALESEPVDPRL